MYSMLNLFRKKEKGLFFLTYFIETWRDRLMANSKRTRVTLECTECKHRNYNLTKDKKAHPERMETKKYCKFCRKHTIHKETK